MAGPGSKVIGTYYSSLYTISIGDIKSNVQNLPKHHLQTNKLTKLQQPQINLIIYLKATEILRMKSFINNEG